MYCLIAESMYTYDTYIFCISYVCTYVRTHKPETHTNKYICTEYFRGQKY